MKKRLSIATLVVFIIATLGLSHAFAQTAKGTIAGRVADDSGGVLPSAHVTSEPLVGSVFSDQQGEFTIPSVPIGEYKLTISYRGFTPFSATVVVNSGQVSHLQAVLHVASIQEQILVRAERPHGEAEAINRQLAADNIVQVLPAKSSLVCPMRTWLMRLGGFPVSRWSGMKAKENTCRFAERSLASATSLLTASTCPRQKAECVR